MHESVETRGRPGRGVCSGGLVKLATLLFSLM